jgi:hypothetical protein
MTPEERNLIIDLFDRLATLEDAQRDPDAERSTRMSGGSTTQTWSVPFLPATAPR